MWRSPNPLLHIARLAGWLLRLARRALASSYGAEPAAPRAAPGSKKPSSITSEPIQSEPVQNAPVASTAIATASMPTTTSPITSTSNRPQHARAALPGRDPPAPPLATRFGLLRRLRSPAGALQVMATLPQQLARAGRDRAAWFAAGLSAATAMFVVYQLVLAPALGSPRVPPARPTPLPVVVEVEGEVLAPGIFEIAPHARVADVIQQAGGLTAQADISRLNLANHLADGQRIVVPRQPVALGARPAHTPWSTFAPRPSFTAFATDTPRPTRTPFPTNTPRPTFTERPTFTPRPTRTPFPTNTPRPTRTPFPTRTPRRTSTPRPIHAPRPTSMPHPTSTPPAALVPEVLPPPGGSATPADAGPRPGLAPEPTRADDGQPESFEAALARATREVLAATFGFEPPPSTPGPNSRPRKRVRTDTGRKTSRPGTSTAATRSAARRRSRASAGALHDRPRPGRRRRPCC